MNLTLGNFINKLETTDLDKRVQYDFANYSVTELNSYRGYYKDLALGYTDDYSRPITTVKELLLKAKFAVNGEFYGYKGGIYLMNKDTKLWAANYGYSTNTAIVDVKEYDSSVVIVTGYID